MKISSHVKKWCLYVLLDTPTRSLRQLYAEVLLEYCVASRAISCPEGCCHEIRMQLHSFIANTIRSIGSKVAAKVLE